MPKNRFPYETILEKWEVGLVKRYFKGIWMSLYLYFQLLRRSTNMRNVNSYIRSWINTNSMRIYQSVFLLISNLSFCEVGVEKGNEERMSFLQKGVRGRPQGEPLVLHSSLRTDPVYLNLWSLFSAIDCRHLLRLVCALFLIAYWFG